MNKQVVLLATKKIIIIIKTETRDKWHVGAANRPF